MKLSKISGGFGIAILTGALTLGTPTKTRAQTTSNNVDRFEYVNKKTSKSPLTKTRMSKLAKKLFSQSVTLPPAKGSSADSILAFAPSPKIIVEGKQRILTFVVDVTNNILYHYDKLGNPIKGYRIASGKLTPNCQTDEGLRIVSHIETYPYRSAPSHTKRNRNPRDYGPKCIILDKLDQITGAKSSTGEFIHGNRDATSIGKHASMGCMRMDNDVIQDLARVVKRGDLVLIIRRVR